jgi:hypothetical protein
LTTCTDKSDSRANMTDICDSVQVKQLIQHRQ